MMAVVREIGLMFWGVLVVVGEMSKAVSKAPELCLLHRVPPNNPRLPCSVPR